MSRCLGFPECRGTAGNSPHVPKCPMYEGKQVDEITEPLPARQIVDLSKIAVFLVTKAVVADSIEDALKREKAGEGKLLSIQLSGQHD